MNNTISSKESYLNILMESLKEAEERAEKEGWIAAEDLEKELEGLE